MSKRVFISAGHGGGDNGATAFGRTEAAIVMGFRDMVAFYLEQAKVPFTRDGGKGENLSLRQAVRLIPEGAIAVEFHLNAAPNAAATGVETLQRDANKTLGAELCTTVAETLGIRNRGAKPEGSGQHTRLAFVSAGGIILELFFLTNPDDLAAYDAKKWLVAKSVADVLARWSNRK